MPRYTMYDMMLDASVFGLEIIRFSQPFHNPELVFTIANRALLQELDDVESR